MLDQSRSVSNGNEGVTPYSPALQTHHQMHFGGGFLSLFLGGGSYFSVENTVSVFFRAIYFSWSVKISISEVVDKNKVSYKRKYTSNQCFLMRIWEILKMGLELVLFSVANDVLTKKNIADW